jgi:hypothetical protein
VLVLPFHPKGTEHEDKNEDIIDAHGLLDDVAGEELKRFLAAVCVKNPEIERERNAYPEHAPDSGFAHGYFMRAAIQDAEVEDEQEENSRIENNPEGWSAHATSVVPARLIVKKVRE